MSVNYAKPATSVNVKELLLDPATLIIGPEPAATAAPIAKPAGTTKYYRIPKDWHDILMTIRPKSWAVVAVGLHIYREWCMRNGTQRVHNCIPLGNVALKKLDIDRREKLVALHRLEDAGLIRVQWRDRASPLVTVVETVAFNATASVT